VAATELSVLQSFDIYKHLQDNSSCTYWVAASGLPVLHSLAIETVRAGIILGVILPQGGIMLLVLPHEVRYQY